MEPTTELEYKDISMETVPKKHINQYSTQGRKDCKLACFFYCFHTYILGYAYFI